GIGYRNPTGVITGNVSFDGGSPVKDVVVRADPQGADQQIGSSLKFTDNSLLLIPLRNHELDDAVTLQAWVKLASGQTGSLFKLDSTNSLNDVEVNYATTPNAITLTVAYDGDF